jgi:hypothetical protein
MSQFFIGTTAGNLPPVVPLQFTTDSGIAVPAANNLNVFGADGATTEGVADTITIRIINDGFPWSEESISFAAAVQHGYFCTAALTATLPASGGLVLGNTIIIVVDTSSTVTIQAGVGESIQVSSTISAAGGTASSNTRGSVLELVFRPSDLTWHTISSLGVWTVT